MTIIWEDLTLDEVDYVLSRVSQPLAVLTDQPGARTDAEQTLGDPDTWPTNTRDRDQRGEGPGHKFHGNQWGSGGIPWSGFMEDKKAEVWAKDSVIQGYVWHGTPSDRTALQIYRNGFDPAKAKTGGALGDGIYVTRDKGYARLYGRTVRARVDVRNPISYEKARELMIKEKIGAGKAEGERFIGILKARGYDSVHWNTVVQQGGGDEIMVFDKHQIVVTGLSPRGQ